MDISDISSPFFEGIEILDLNRDISLFVQAVRFGGFSEAGRDEVDRFDELGSDEGLAGRVAGALGDKEIQVGVAATRVAGPPSDAYGSRAGQQFRN